MNADHCGADAEQVEDKTHLVKFVASWHKKNIQGVFLTGTPPKSSKYKQVILG